MGYTKSSSKGGSGVKIQVGTPHTVALGTDKRVTPATIKRKGGK